MSCFLLADEEESSGKISIDELFQKRKNRDLKQLSIFNKILNRIHIRIKTTARMKNHETFVFFVVPEFIFGEPCYDNANCISYLIAQLKKNGFSIRYYHPNTLLVSWNEYVPTYVRTQIKKKTGMIVNEKGEHVGGAGFDDDDALDDNDRSGGNDHKSSSAKSGGGGHDHTAMNVPADDLNAGILNRGFNPGHRGRAPIKQPTQNNHNHNHNHHQQQQYNPINTYRPTGNLIYPPDYFDRLEKKVSFAL